MNEFIKKQRHFKTLRNGFLIGTAVLLFLYIGAEPFLANAYGSVLPFQLSLFALVLVSLALLFFYEAHYAKALQFVEDSLYEIEDAGYYYLAEPLPDEAAYIDSVRHALTSNGFRVYENTEANGISYDFTAIKGSEYFYLTTVAEADRNDVIAYLDTAQYNLMQNRMRSKGNGLVVIVCNIVDEEAVALSKAVVRIFSGKRLLKLGVAIVELNSGRVYTRGNETCVLQKLIAFYALNTVLPIPKDRVGNDKLRFQTELKEKLDGFNLKDFQQGTYFER